LSVIDYKKQIIPDKIVLPAIVILLIAKQFENSLGLDDIVGAFLVVSVFLIPIAFNMAFGGGDLRFGFFCAIFVGLAGVGYFVICSAILHVVLLKTSKKDVSGFAPAMSLGAVLVYGGLNFL
jgi:prepilin signal peptidase PulO-like enzyme (type II secretory pathway)